MKPLNNIFHVSQSAVPHDTPQQVQPQAQAAQPVFNPSGQKYQTHTGAGRFSKYMQANGKSAQARSIRPARKPGRIRTWPICALHRHSIMPTMLGAPLGLRRAPIRIPMQVLQRAIGIPAWACRTPACISIRVSPGDGTTGPITGPTTQSSSRSTRVYGTQSRSGRPASPPSGSPVLPAGYSFAKRGT